MTGKKKLKRGWFCHTLHHAGLLLHSNSFWLATAMIAYAAGTNLDPTWYKAHPQIEIYATPIIGIIAVVVKLLQNIKDEQKAK